MFDRNKNPGNVSNPPRPQTHECKCSVVTFSFREQHRENRKQRDKPQDEVGDEEDFPECTRDKTCPVEEHGAKLTVLGAQCSVVRYTRVLCFPNNNQK